MINGQSVNKPSLKVILDDVETRIFQTMNCVKIGRIVSFDATLRTAVVQISFKRELAAPLEDGTTIVDYPQLFDCPVVSMQGGGGALTFPVIPGDECLILFSDSNIDAWYQNGSAQSALPLDGRRHDLSDGIAIVGLNSQANAISPAVTASEVALTYSGAKIGEKSGKINISNATQSMLTAFDTFCTALAGTPTPAQVGTAAAALKVSIDALFY